MEDNTLLMVFTGVLAFAVLVQTFLFLGMYLSIRRMTNWMDGLRKDLLRNVEKVSAKVEESLSEIKSVSDSFKPIRDNLVNATEIVRNRAADLDAFVAQTIKTAQLEILRIQDTIEIITSRARETVELLHAGVQYPITEFNALSRALRVGFDILFRRKRNLSNASAQDEEMFI
jgi:hypothetical protein